MTPQAKERAKQAMYSLLGAITDARFDATPASAACWGIAIGVYLGVHRPGSALRIRDALLREWAEKRNETLEDRERRVQELSDQVLQMLGPLE